PDEVPRAAVGWIFVLSGLADRRLERAHRADRAELAIGEAPRADHHFSGEATLAERRPGLRAEGLFVRGRRAGAARLARQTEALHGGAALVPVEGDGEPVAPARALDGLALANADAGEARLLNHLGAPNDVGG